jgi:hypothetical protein
MNDAESEPWYVRADGRIRGPFSLTALKQQCDRNRLRPTDELSPDRRRWVGAASVAGLFPPQHEKNPPDTKWYFMRDGRRQGPVTLAALQQSITSGVCAANDLIWSKGMPEWTPCYLVPDVASVASPKTDRRNISPWARVGLAVACILMVAVPVGLVLILNARDGENERHRAEAKRIADDNKQNREAILKAAEINAAGADKIADATLRAAQIAARANPRSSSTGQSRDGNDALDSAEFPLGKITRDGFSALVARICPEQSHPGSARVFTTTMSCVWVQLVLFWTDEKATGSEYQALVNYCVNTYFTEGPIFNDGSDGLDANPDTSNPDWQRLLEKYESRINGIVDFHNNFAATKASDPAGFETKRRVELAKFKDKESVRYYLLSRTPDEVLAELRRFRNTGPLRYNHQPPLANSHRDIAFEVGDKVCNNGTLILWTGTIVTVNGKSYEVRIDYVNKLPFVGKKYEVGKNYSFVEGEFKHKTANSIGSFIGDR